jgi:ubiquinone biosynthesis protein
VAEEAPRFLRAASARMEAPSPPPRDDGTARAVRLAAWLIGGAVVLHAAAELLIHWI